MANYNRICWTEAMDAEVRRAYQRGERGATRQLATRFGVLPSSVSDRAARLGLPPLIKKHQDRTGDWGPREIALVEQHQLEPIKQIRARLYRAGYRRSLSALSTLLYRLRARGQLPTRADALFDRGVLTAEELAAGMGVSGPAVSSWRQQGLLRGAQSEPGGVWRYRMADVRDFLLTWPAHWDHRPADRWFLLDLLTYQTAPRRRPDRPSAARQLPEAA